jgi:hypothetical protein
MLQDFEFVDVITKDNLVAELAESRKQRDAFEAQAWEFEVTRGKMFSFPSLPPIT